MADPGVRRVRAIIVAEHGVQANALALLLATDPAIDVVSSEGFVERARTAILREAPDVVVIHSTDSQLCRFSRLLDLRLALPDLGFVVVPGDLSGRALRRVRVDRAVAFLPTHFVLDDLLSSVGVMGRATAADHDRDYISVPIAI